ncbi:MAG: peptidoglycan DD-metalloendopeptidase family protein, partial [Planctomycetota bacterium]
MLLRNRRIPRIESLEERQLLNADLAILDAYLINGVGARIDNPVEGQSLDVRVQYEMNGLADGRAFRVSFSLNGMIYESDYLFAEQGQGVIELRDEHVGYAAKGANQQVSVLLDSANAIEETDESNNAMQFEFTPRRGDLQQKHIFPVVGEPGVDWSIVNYVDMDPRRNFARDFENGIQVGDGSQGWAIGVASQRQIDLGQSVVASADGIVIAASDGLADRENSDLRNYVRIDHGYGWETGYYYLQRDSITVEVGELVTQGQTIGLLGSSGDKYFPHLFYDFRYIGRATEPMLAATDYFYDPPEYTGAREPQVLAGGMTNSDPSNEIFEEPVPVDTFHIHGGDEANGTRHYPWIWFVLEYALEDDNFVTTWTRPEGTESFESQWSPVESLRNYNFWAWTSRIDQVGEWTVTTERNGVEIFRHNFNVVSSDLGEPDLEVRWNGNLIIDNRLTTVNLGSMEQGEIAAPTSFILRNAGTADLEIHEVRLPEGFQLAAPAPLAIAPQEEAELRVQLDSAVVDRFWGQLEVATNDVGNPLYRFPLEGRVDGDFASGRPIWTSQTKPKAIDPGQA